jgi:hypothetical protein
MNYQAIVKSEGPLYAAGLTILQARDWRQGPRNAGLADILDPVQFNKLNKVYRRKECTRCEVRSEINTRAEKRTKREIYRMALGRKTFRAIFRNFSINELWNRVYNNTNINLNTSLEDLLNHRKEIGYTIRRIEKEYINSHEVPKKADKPLFEAMPLYTCSGELEATGMDVHRINKISKGKGMLYRRHCLWKHSAHLNFAQDGGGQAETQFLIRPELTRLVCGLVTSIGSQSRNGGHIHINCGKDEAVGHRVYAALRFNLTWMRWLVPYSRRSGHWSNMGTVASCFDRAKTIKATALSANTWNRTGTVEMRLWGTSKKPEDWLGRRDIMQAIANWSAETMDINDVYAYPLAEETTRIAWPAFVRWSAVNAPEALAYALRTIRKKCRSRATAQKDKDACNLLWQEFESTGVRVRGFRRRNPVVL